MDIIKILDTKENKNVGYTITNIPTNLHYFIKYIGDIPDKLKKYISIIKIEFNENSDKLTFAELINPDNKKKFLGLKNCEVTIEQDYISVEHPPIPKYNIIYNTKSKITCNECKNIIEYGEIIFDECDQCPICSSFESFNYEFEKMN